MFEHWPLDGDLKGSGSEGRKTLSSKGVMSLNFWKRLQLGVERRQRQNRDIDE